MRSERRSNTNRQLEPHSGGVSFLFNPPPSDRELTKDLVRLTLGQQFPDLDVEQVQHLGSGWEYDVYLVNGHLVIRFPRYAEVADGLDRAEATLEFVGNEIGSEVTVPKISLRGIPGPHFPHPFFGHELIPGVPASDPSAPLSEGLAQDLGSALTRIHAIPTSGATRLGIGPQKWHCRSSFEALVEVFEGVPEVPALLPEAGIWVRASPALPGEYQGPDRFIHDDFQPEHIVVHPETGRLSGILDWGPALGDPAQDLSFLAATWGWDFTTMVLDAYRGPVDPCFLPRLLFLGRVRALGWLAYETQVGLDTRHTESVVRDLLARPG